VREKVEKEWLTRVYWRSERKLQVLEDKKKKRTGREKKREEERKRT